jgi:type IV secretion system protein VirB9
LELEVVLAGEDDMKQLLMPDDRMRHTIDSAACIADGATGGLNAILANCRTSFSFDPPRASEPEAGTEQHYVFAPGNSYTVRCSLHRVTSLALQPGERVLETFVGDRMRWILQVSRQHDGQPMYVAVKPVKADLSTNLVIHTDRRTYPSNCARRTPWLR